MSIDRKFCQQVSARIRDMVRTDKMETRYIEFSNILIEATEQVVPVETRRANLRWMTNELLDMMAKRRLLRLQTTQPTSGGAVTADSSCCANCVEPPRPQQWGPDLPFFGHADPLDGWRCCSQKRVMSRPIQVRQL